MKLSDRSIGIKKYWIQGVSGAFIRSEMTGLFWSLRSHCLVLRCLWCSKHGSLTHVSFPISSSEILRLSQFYCFKRLFGDFSTGGFYFYFSYEMRHALSTNLFQGFHCWIKNGTCMNRSQWYSSNFFHSDCTSGVSFHNNFDNSNICFCSIDFGLTRTGTIFWVSFVKFTLLTHLNLIARIL